MRSYFIQSDSIQHNEILTFLRNIENAGLVFLIWAETPYHIDQMAGKKTMDAMFNNSSHRIRPFYIFFFFHHLKLEQR